MRQDMEASVTRLEEAEQSVAELEKSNIDLTDTLKSVKQTHANKHLELQPRQIYPPTPDLPPYLWNQHDGVGVQVPSNTADTH